MSMGTNDFLQNYYLEPIRPKQYTLEEYQNYLASCMFEDVKVPPCLSAIYIIYLSIYIYSALTLFLIEGKEKSN